jgi:hypothetical protein
MVIEACNKEHANSAYTEAYCWTVACGTRVYDIAYEKRENPGNWGPYSIAQASLVMLSGRGGLITWLDP